MTDQATKTELIKFAIGDMLDTEIEADEWDLSPDLSAIVDFDGTYLFLSMPVPWQEAPVPNLLPVIAQTLTLLGVPPLPSPSARLVGVCLRIESWSFHVKDDDPPELREQLMRWASERSIADHPLGAESKQVLALDVKGTQFLAHHLRGSGTRRVDVCAPGDDTHVLEGRVFDGLGLVLAALKAGL